jgi:polysaccharide export outer membrane protein
MATTVTSARARIGAGDLLEISVFQVPELNCKARVSGDGDIVLPLAGVVHASGLLPDQLRDLIAARLVSGEFVKKPQVSVFVAEYANQTVYVIGEVVRPGPYPLLGSHRLLDFVSAAGGLTTRASNTAVLTTRADKKPQRRTISLETDAADDANPQVEAGDTIQVVAAGIAYVLGDVNRPGGFVLSRNEGFTVMKLLAVAEGTKETAKLRAGRLIRVAEDGSRLEVPVDLTKVFDGAAPDQVIREGDILFIPGSLTRGAAKRGIEAIVQAATGVAIYRR